MIAGVRRSPYDSARDHARRTADAGGGVECCPYRGESWKTVWIRELISRKQMEIVDEIQKLENSEKEKNND